MPPSKWISRNKDAGHDGMQVLVLNQWRQRIKSGGKERTINRNGRLYSAVSVEAEFLFSNGPDVLGFADIAIQFQDLAPPPIAAGANGRLAVSGCADDIGHTPV